MTRSREIGSLRVSLDLFERLGRLWAHASGIPRSLRRPYLRSLLPGGSALAEGLPWITFGAIAELEQFLRPQMRVFEWGAGGSTIFLAARAHLVSIEHDPDYRDRVAAELSRRGLTADLRLVDLGAYAEAIDSYPPGCFDLVVVDGQVREQCLAHAKGKVRAGGWFILDDAHAGEYAATIALADGWGPRRDHRGLFPANLQRGRLYRKQTSIWVVT